MSPIISLINFVKNYVRKAHLRDILTSKMELIRTFKQVKPLNWLVYSQKVPSEIFDLVLTTPLHLLKKIDQTSLL